MTTRDIDPVHPLRGATVAVGISAGIAAYKAVELVRLLTTAGATVHAVMTERARKFVGELTLQAITGRPVFTDLFNLTQESEIGHIQLADRAELIVAAPATANLIARLAAGMADDVLTAVILASKAKLLIAPSMNVNMWQHPLTQANVARLTEVAGAAFVGPGAGFLACRWVGPGRLAEPIEIAEAAARMLSPRDLAGRIVVISAGPTREQLDPVRFLGNQSSGKMGYALAAAAARRGATVRLVSGPVALDPPAGAEVARVESAREMALAIDHAMADGRVDAVVMAAAVADFRPAEVAADKIKKKGVQELALSLTRNPDILAQLGQARAERGGTRPLLVGFAAETSDLVRHARDKLDRKRCDLIVANDVSEPDAGFGVDTNRVVLVRDGDDDERFELAGKDEIAHRIWDRVVAMLDGDAASPPA